MHEDILYYFISEMFIYSILYYLEDTRDKFSNILYFISPSFLHFNAFKKKNIGYSFISIRRLSIFQTEIPSKAFVINDQCILIGAPAK